MQSHRIKIVSYWWEVISLVIPLYSLVQIIVRPIRSLIRFHMWENSHRFFPPFVAVMRSNWSECLQRFLLSQNHSFKVCKHKFSGTIYRGPRQRNYKKENSTECREIEFISSFWMFYDHSFKLVRPQIINKVDLYRCSYSWWSIQHFYQQP